jgi:acyl-[acyl-carrier-protein] desaturase
MRTLEKSIDDFVQKFLVVPENIWQPSDLLPDPQSDKFLDQVKEIQELSKDLSDDFWVVLVGDMITEEALPSYQTFFNLLEGINEDRNVASLSSWV